MFKLPGYQKIKELFRGNERIYYAGEKEQETTAVIIKTHFLNAGTYKTKNQLRNEFAILQSVKGHGIPKVYHLETYPGGIALVMEYIKGRLFSEYIAKEKIDLPNFMAIAISAANALSMLHHQNIIHNNIHPDNLLINNRTKEIWVVDFRLASVMPKEKPRSVNLQVNKESLRYMSPEHTGRMNRDIDSRTDLYSLGILFYKMLTGRFPFESSEPMEIVHGHLAKQPEPPNEIDNEIPDVISGMIMKLLAKNPEDRYSGVRGLLRDLKKCHLQFKNRLRIENFNLGEEDVSEKFQISEKIYGRENEIRELLNLLEKASEGKSCLAIISGNPGVGKTSLVHEVYKLVTEKKGFFITGKFDQYHQNIPYAALGHALQKLTKNLLAESEASLREWKQKLLAALGDYGQIIIDVIPDIEMIIGPQPNVKKLDAVESQNRFNRLMVDFIRVFCGFDNPLVIFLDDLQWADKATINFIENIMADVRTHYFLMVISYRENEVSREHPLYTSIQNMKQADCVISHLRLEVLNSQEITRLLADTLRTKEHSIKTLVELVMGKTGGNPFFIKQFLNILHLESLIYFDNERGYWEWKLDEIRSLEITDNVVELLLGRLERMPQETQNILMIGACLGNHFSMKSLRGITNHTDAEIIQYMLPAIRQDLVLTSSDYGDPVAADSTNLYFSGLSSIRFKFRHDRIRQASYTLADETNRKPIHLKIGWMIYESLPGDKLEEGIYQALHHLNIAADLITDLQEKDEVAELNLVAGIKAKGSSAFEPAFAFFLSGIKRLDDDSWIRRYPLTLRLYTECAEAALLCGALDATDKFAETVLKEARTASDRLGAYLIKIRALISFGHRSEALLMAHKTLEEFGMNLPMHPTQSDAQACLKNTMRELSEISSEDIANLARNKNSLHLAEMKILESMLGPAYQTSPEWFIISICQQVRLSVKHGNIPNSAQAYIAFGVIVCEYTDDIDTGYKFGLLGLKLYKRFSCKELEAKIYTAYYAGIYHWKNHLQEALNFLVEAHNSGLETGDFEFAAYSIVFYCCYLLLSGKLLEEIKNELFYYMNSIKSIKQMTSVVYISIFLQTVLNLQGESRLPCNLDGDIYDESAMLPKHHERGDNAALMFLAVSKIMLCYLFGQYEEAAKHAKRASEIDRVLPGLAIIPVYHFFDSLCRLALFSKADEKEQNLIVIRVKRNQAKLKRWMEHAPMNFGQKFYLVEAELAKIRKDHDSALRHYAMAIRQARKGKFVHEEALANELAAKFWIERNQPELAGLFLERAYACYTHWGASRKASHLLKSFPQLQSESFPNHETDGSQLDSPGAGEGSFDLKSLIKASQTISSEIVLENLLQTMMKIVIENAGAETGLLILSSGEQLQVLAKGEAKASEIVVHSVDAAANGADYLPVSIINYVTRTREYMVVNNPLNERHFRHDPYIRTHKPRSALCFPIINQSKMLGVIYLENRLAADIFSPDRIEVLKLLSSQIAISFENTKLFDKLKLAEAKYRNIFENAIEGVFQSLPAGRFVDVNPAMAQILGYESPAELCRRITDIETQVYESPQYRKQFLDKLVANGEVTDFEAPFLRQDGTVIWASVNGRGHFDEKGRLTLIEGFIIDITEKKAAIDEMRQTAKDLRKENILLRSNIRERYKLGRIIGKSAQMQEVYDLILKAAATEAPVIIYGESGTGKELVARAIHDLSDRKDRIFVPVNCGAIPENLLESEFFGYRRGAFTGAYADKKGYLDQASEGTLFLDELGEIGLTFQVKLLRALEDGSFTPLGDRVGKTSNARVISATSRDLQQAIRNGLMREDFFYRVHIIPIHLPPLRDRKEDIPLLFEYYIKSHIHAGNAPPVTGKMIDALLDYYWPGNVRELRNVIDRYCTLGKLDFLFPAAKAAATPQKELYPAEGGIDDDYQTFIETAEKQLIIKSLERFGWNRTKAALHLGMPRRSFYRKLKKYQLI